VSIRAPHSVTKATIPNQIATPRANAEYVRQSRIDPTPRICPPSFRAAAALHPTKLNEQLSAEPYEELFPKLRCESRAEQKRMLNRAIERTKTDNVVMGDPRTDTRPLILREDMATT
jgi:hypothetical protein